MPSKRVLLSVSVCFLASVALGIEGLFKWSRPLLPGAQGENAKSAILFIGDGMGPAFLTGARIWRSGSRSKLSMEGLPVGGFVKTYSANSFVTDSAAAASAMATGVKVNNGTISMSPSQSDSEGRSRKLQSLLAVAKASGKSVGIVTTDKITGGTPAAFYGHAKSRKEKLSLAVQLKNASLDLALGGGSAFFYPTDHVDPQSGKKGTRKDGRNLVLEMKNEGWRVLSERADLKPFPLGRPVLGLFAHMSLPWALENQSAPRLFEMVGYAIDHLSKNPRGYVLIVESSLIDVAGHANHAKRAFSEVLELDRAVQTAMDRVSADTLMVVTADHETGGLALNGYGPIDLQGPQLLEDVYGPSFYHKGTEVKKKCLAAIKARDKVLIKSLKCKRRASVSWATGPGGESSPHGSDHNDYTHRAAYFHGPEQAAYHTAVDVPILASGPGQLRFSGFLENSAIGVQILGALGLEFTSPVNLEHLK